MYAGFLLLAVGIVSTGRLPRRAAIAPLIAVLVWLPFPLASDEVYAFEVAPAGLVLHGDDLIALAFGASWFALGWALLTGRDRGVTVRTMASMVSIRGGRALARLGVTIGALAGIALTLPFALAFHDAYGSGEVPRLVPGGVSPWLYEHGLLGGDTTAVYDRYGVAYLVALGLVTASVFALARPTGRGGLVVHAGLVVLCVGIFGDYAVPNDVVGGIGFLLEGIGLLVVAVGVGLVVRGRVGVLAGAGAALATLACMVAGAALTGHIPSGPGLTILLGAFVFALRERNDPALGGIGMKLPEPHP